MTTIDPTATFEIDGHTYRPGDVVAVQYRDPRGQNDEIVGIFAGTAELTADDRRTILGAAIVVNYEGDDVIVTACELIAIATTDDATADALAEIAAFTR